MVLHSSRVLAVALCALGGGAVVRAAVEQRNATPVQQWQWLAITSPGAQQALEPLIAHRRAEGFNVTVLETTEMLRPDEIRNQDGASLRKRIAALAGSFTGPTYVLLAGAVENPSPTNSSQVVVPSLRGSQARMKGEATDAGYGLPGPDGTPVLRVGRFPARTPAELSEMVQKTLNFERAIQAEDWQNRLVLLVGNPGGGMLPELFMQQSLKSHLASLHPIWALRTLINIGSSPFYMPRPQDRQTALKYLQEGELFSIYLGHSGAEGMGLDAQFIPRQEWSQVNIPQGAGPFFTCGCYACQSNVRGDGYGLAAMRNPAGPVAVIGASGESYSAPGQLAVEGLLACLTNPPFAERLGDYWLAIQTGLARGPMDATTFSLLDSGDGTGGKVPLASQRLEHLEMWMLLGDPALKLPVVPVDIALEAAGPVSAGKTFEVHGTLPARLQGALVRLALERPLDSSPQTLEKVPRNSPENRTARERAFAANHEKANSFVLATVEAKANGREFAATLRAPATLGWRKVVLRASAAAGDNRGLGVVSLPVTTETSAERTGTGGS